MQKSKEDLRSQSEVELEEGEEHQIREEESFD